MSLSSDLLYTLDFSQFHHHIVQVTLKFRAPTDAPTLWLPTWLAGSYLIREFAQHISHVHYCVEDTVPQRAPKHNKNTWQLPDVHAGQMVTVTYPVYCYDVSVRTAYVDGTRLFGNFSSLLLMPTGLEMAPCVIDLNAKAFLKAKPDSVLVCGLAHRDTANGYRLDTLPNGDALSAFAALDFPFEIAPQVALSFLVQSTHQDHPHRVFISGKCAFDDTRLTRDAQKICQSYADLLGWLPFAHYTFMAHATGKDYGGLEHINSTALIIPRGDLPSCLEQQLPSADYQRLLGLMSHEYFHAWWVKSVRPEVMIDSMLQSEAYTTLLWVFEGFTSYVDDLMLYISGVIDTDSYLTLVAEQINRYLNTHGRHVQSVAESSFDAWIKLYRPNENSTNSSISYYNKGALIALCLDLMISEHSDGKASLFDVIRHFVKLAEHAEQARYGMSETSLDTVMTNYLPAATWQAFRDAHIYGVAELPVLTLLGASGISVSQTQQHANPFGLYTESSAQGLKVSRIHPDGAAAKAGLSAHDVIVAIDGFKADAALLARHERLAQAENRDVHIHAFRRDVLMCFTVPCADRHTQVDVKLAVGDSTWLQRGRFFAQN